MTQPLPHPPPQHLVPRPLLLSPLGQPKERAHHLAVPLVLKSHDDGPPDGRMRRETLLDLEWVNVLSAYPAAVSFFFLRL